MLHMVQKIISLYAMSKNINIAIPPVTACEVSPEFLLWLFCMQVSAKQPGVCCISIAAYLLLHDRILKQKIRYICSKLQLKYKG